MEKNLPGTKHTVPGDLVQAEEDSGMLMLSVCIVLLVFAGRKGKRGQVSGQEGS
jgi:hypothetical protein